MPRKKLTKARVGSMLAILALIGFLILALPTLYVLATQLVVPVAGTNYGKVYVGSISNEDGDLCVDLGYRLLEGSLVFFPELKLHVYIDDQLVPRSQMEFIKISDWFDPGWTTDSDGVCLDYPLSSGSHQIRTIIVRGFGDFEMRVGDFNVLEDGTIQRN
jgi:hypothetical protein